MAPFGIDAFRVGVDTVDDGVAGDVAVGLDFVCCTVGMVTTCEFSSFISGCEDDGEFKPDDEGTEMGALDDTNTVLSENCGGNGPDFASSRGTAFSIGESENEVAA